MARAHHAYDLLSSWHTIPGTRPDGTINQDDLFAWVDRARAACEGRRNACDTHIGQVLAYAPTGGDGLWPHESVRALIEYVNTRALKDGFRTGVLNKRGVTIRDPFAGGAQERVLAQQYRTWAQSLAPANPRTAAVLSEIADDYEREAHAEDVRAAQRDLRH